MTRPERSDLEFLAINGEQQAAVLQRALRLAIVACGVALLAGVLLFFVIPDRSDAVALGVCAAGGAICCLVILRFRARIERRELQVTAGGLRATEFGRSRSWRWEEIRALGVTGGVIHRLVVEDSHADAVHFPLTGMEPGESTILDAIHEASQGRFPGSARGLDPAAPAQVAPVDQGDPPATVPGADVDLFRGDALVLDVDGLDFQVSGAAGPVAQIGYRSPDEAVHRQFLRLFSSVRTPPSTYVVDDADDVRRLEIVRHAGSHRGFELTVTTADGSIVGAATAEQDLFAVFPKIWLTEASGQAMGHLEGRGALEAYDAHGRRVGVLGHLQPERTAFGKPRFSLEFLGDVSPRLRVMVVAGVIGWHTTHTSV